MKVHFILREPGNHRRIASSEMDVIPREGETVVLGVGELERPPLTVHAVTYYVDHKMAEVLVK